jgi:hypothetical protein
MVRQVLQTGLEVEMNEHLGYERHDPDLPQPTTRTSSAKKAQHRPARMRA